VIETGGAHNPPGVVMLSPPEAPRNASEARAQSEGRAREVGLHLDAAKDSIVQPKPSSFLNRLDSH
jgi:hypothetical protein